MAILVRRAGVGPYAPLSTAISNVCFLGQQQTWAPLVDTSWISTEFSGRRGEAMTIEELGIITDIGGSVAVIATLGFLAFQVSRARLEVSRQNARDMVNNNNDVLLRLSENDALLDVHIRGQKDFASLTEAERMKWAYWLFAWITQTEQGYIDRRQRDFSGMMLDEYVEGLALVLRSEGGKVMWLGLKAWFDPEFCTAVERQISKSSTTQVEHIAGLERPSSTS